ncbi:hypothetical protein AVEN_128441-1 [Araneus ventricosus]|uniref:Uncharacterized protein n=1 Tax=Araneus ventricosus TaxID=182803 RepID=A0A4Y2PPS8_ARAVE|nr:hypothetical protein AVEN_128441-1 [Araneus ventricosus]
MSLPTEEETKIRSSSIKGQELQHSINRKSHFIWRCGDFEADAKEMPDWLVLGVLVEGPYLDMPNQTYARLQQVSHGKSENLKQVIANELVTTCRTCYKLVASNSLQTIAKTEYADKPRIRHPDNPLHSSRPRHSAGGTQIGEDRLR